ncbi:DUF3024 domain-containing protein [Pseudoalteromonas agarivorans]|uniref:DUF3024 domain-containing protein n=1 Tax=Pseudoalteromonas agarivorans TaxID=176102 RepID=UPI002117DDC3|nr:DUF3024 domain-containing protein [Pseudoalteromonas agarivorans]MCQ8884263.1 DUF3024 domain-containing protein [Pseudoalteromonas agarivorans]
MALTEFEIKKIEKAANAFLNKRRPPVHIRNELDIGWRLEKQSVYIYETRPVWDSPNEYHDLDMAKATFIRAQGKWKIFWMRQDLKWHGYEPNMYVKTIEQVFAVIDHDEYACFFG